MTTRLASAAAATTNVSKKILAPEPHFFANRWLKTLPRRWARNGALFNTIVLLGQHRDQKWIKIATEYPSVIPLFLVEFIASVGAYALLIYVIGRLVRWSVSPVGVPNWDATARAIQRKCVLGSLFFVVVYFVSSLVFGRHTWGLTEGWTGDAVGRTIGQIIGATGVAGVVGFVIGYASRRGLRKAIADDEILILSNIRSAEAS